eukprot:scaffold203150_cov20-Prasinocladus_malaysianus.AAC.1
MQHMFSRRLCQIRKAGSSSTNAPRTSHAVDIRFMHGSIMASHCCEAVRTKNAFKFYGINAADCSALHVAYARMFQQCKNIKTCNDTEAILRLLVLGEAMHAVQTHITSTHKHKVLVPTVVPIP